MNVNDSAVNMVNKVEAAGARTEKALEAEASVEAGRAGRWRRKAKRHKAEALNRNDTRMKHV